MGVPLIDIIYPVYRRQTIENLIQNLNALAAQLSRVWVDESARLAVRVGYVDDGYVRVRDAGDTSYTLTNLTIDLLRGLQYGFGVIESPLTSIAGALASRATDKLRASVVDALPESPFNITKVAGTALTARDWSSDFAKLQNIDTTLSSRASESTLSGLSGKFPSASALADNLSNPTTTIIGAANLGWDGTYWRRLASDTSGRLRVSADVVVNPSNLDVALSTRASEATLSALKNALASVATDKFRVSVVDALPQSPVTIQTDNVGLAKDSTLSGLSGKFPSAAALSDSLGNPTTTIVGDAMLGFDGTYWRRVRVDTSGRLAIQNQPNLDVALSTIKAGTDYIDDIYNRLDVALSTRASESTLSGLSGKFPSATELADNLGNPMATIVGAANLGFDGTYWRRLAADTSSRLKVNAEVVANPSNLDVALSTRASESTLSAFSGKFPSATALSDSLSNPTTTLVGAPLLGFDGTYWRRVRVDTSGRLAIQNQPNLDVALSTRASESTLSAIKSQTDKLTFDSLNRLAVQNPPNLDVALSTRASESTLSGLSGKFPSATALADNLSNPTATIIGAANLGWDGTYWRRLSSDTSGRLRVSADVVANPSNLDVALSTRASEATLSALKNALASVATDKFRVTVVDALPQSPVTIQTDNVGLAKDSTLSGLSGKFPSASALSDSLSNPTTTIVGSALLGWDSAASAWERLLTDGSGRLVVRVVGCIH